MRTFLLIVVLWPSLAFGQITDTERKATLAFVASLQDPTSGAFKVDISAKPSLRATAGAVRSYHFLNAKKLSIDLPNAEKVKSFIFTRMDPITGGWSEPDGQADVTITSIGLMAAAQVGAPANMYPRSMDYLRGNAKTFEDVRIGAAALDSLEKKPQWIGDWIKIADAQLNNDGTAGKGDGRARDTASVVAMKLRLGYPVANKPKVIEAIVSGQRTDGGWGKADAKASDLETTYRVMRALMLLKEKPKDAKALNAWLAKHRNPDGGYGLEPGQASSLSAVYYASAITSFLDKTGDSR